MTGRIRVSIVATALDGNKIENKTVLNMFSRAHNKTQLTLTISFHKMQGLITIP